MNDPESPGSAPSFEPTIASPAARPSGVPAVLSIGRYLVQRELGRGAMGVVLLAEDTLLGRQVALKAVGPAPDGHLSLHMTAEARAIARLQHPNVVGLYDVLQQDGHAYLAMEYVEGSDLQRWLQGPWTARERLALFMQVAAGLEAAHGAGVVHRDFKPANVLVGADGRARVSDFGLAAMHGEQDAVARGAVVGTPAYMSPEQFAGKLAGAAADQFGFCVALFEALTAHRPWDAQDLAGLQAAVMRGPPAMPSSIPPAIAALLRRGLSVEPQARFASMRELRLALEAHLIARPGERRAWVAATLALVVVGAAAVFGAARVADPCRLENTRWAQVLPGSGVPQVVRAALESTLGEWQTSFFSACEAQGRAPTWARTRGCFDAVLDDVESVGAAAQAAAPDRPVASLLEFVARPQACLNAATPPRSPLPVETTARQRVVEALVLLVEVVHLGGDRNATEQKARAALAVETALASGHAQTHARALLVKARLDFNQGRTEDFTRAVERARNEALAVGALHEVVRAGLMQAFSACAAQQGDACSTQLDRLQPMLDALDHPWLRALMLEFRANANPDRQATPENLGLARDAWKALPGADAELARIQPKLANALVRAGRAAEALALLDGLVGADADLLDLGSCQLALVRSRALIALDRKEEALRLLNTIREAAARLKLDAVGLRALEEQATLLAGLGRPRDVFNLVEAGPSSVYLQMLLLEALADLGRVDAVAEQIAHLEFPLVGTRLEEDLHAELRRYRLLVALERGELEVLARAREWELDGVHVRLTAEGLTSRGQEVEARAVLRAAAATDWPARSELAMRERRWKDALEILDANAKQVQEVERVQFDLRHAASEAMSLPGPSPACARFAAALNAMQTRSFFALYRNERSRITAEMKARCR